MKKLLLLAFVCLITACNKPISKTDSVYQEILKNAIYKETFKNNTKTICLTTTYDNKRYCSITTYDKNKNKIKDIKCLANPQTDTCKQNGEEKTYDNKGNLIKERFCREYTENNTCIDWRYYGKDYRYDGNNNMIWERQCEWVDKNGDKCMGKDTEDEYDYYHTYQEGYDYTYDEQNRKISKKRCDNHFCKDGSCTGYNHLTEYKYGQKGNLIKVNQCYDHSFIYEYKPPQKNQDKDFLEMIFEDTCEPYPGDNDAKSIFSCPDLSYDEAKGSFQTYDIVELYEYNPQGFLTAKKEGESYEKYLLDEKGNILVKQIDEGLGSYATEYEYDKKNRVIRERNCLGTYKGHYDVSYEVVDLKEDGHCKKFKNEITYTYDEKNHLTRERYLENGKYSINDNAFGLDINYNQNGEIIKLRYCLELDKNGSCTKTGYGQDYIYDSDGNLFMILQVDPQEKIYFNKDFYPSEKSLPSMEYIKNHIPIFVEYQPYSNKEEF